ncbi:MAG TPA: type II toxin-antitoxin system Y4mF family antitoxin [Acidimicrobiales bacterium]|nr:type II toxin-antitoxin system Y4mF family antitoxin [Acidimicrobiales bacterium]
MAGPTGSIARQVRDRRRSLLLTQADLAALAGCSQRFVRAVESGKTTVRFDKLVTLLDAVGLELVTRLRDR